MSKTNGLSSSTKAPKTPKPPKAPRVRAEAIDVAQLIGQPFDINAAMTSLDHATQLYLMRQAATAQLTEFVRRAMKGSAKQPALSGEELKAAIEQWRPSVKRRGKSPIAKISKVVATMSAEERQQLRDLLTAEADKDFDQPHRGHDRV